MAKNKKLKFGLIVITCVIVVSALAGATVVGLKFYDDFKSRSRTVKLGFEDVGELVTQVAYYTSVDKINDPRVVFGVAWPGTTSKCIYSYDGIIKAGIRNCADIQVGEIIDNKIVLNIPDVEILSNTLDEDSLEVYDESKNIFNPLSIEDFNEAREKLKLKSEEDAINNGILDYAKINAENMLKSFVSAFEDLKEYEVVCNWITEE